MLLSRSRPRVTAWLFVGLLAALLPRSAAAQLSPRFPAQDRQLWGDWEGTAPLGEGLTLHLDGGLRDGRDAGHLIYRRVGAGVSFHWGRYLTIEPSYHFYRNDSTPVSWADENRLSLAATAALPLGRWGLNDRNLFEWRFLEHGNFWRYRNRLEATRRLTWRHRRLRVFAWDEVYFDAEPRAWTRNRAALGAGKALSRRVSVDVYFAHQNDAYSHPGDLDSIGITLHTRL